MKIKVVSDDFRLSIPLPNGLIFNRLTAAICTATVKKYTEGIEIPHAVFQHLFREIPHYKQILFDEPLIYVKSNDGVIVEIML